MKKLISVILALVMVFSVFVIGSSAANEVKTKCGGEGSCNDVPTVVIHGVGQSNVWLTDGNGNYVLDGGEKINCFPCYVDTKALVKSLLGPAILSIITQHDMGLSASVDSLVDSLFYMNICDSKGNDSKYVELETYNYSLAECSDYEKGEIYDHIPLEKYSETAGEDHLYYFAYNSFGNTMQIVDRLYNFIELVKEETGHDKVNLVPISMGGAIFNGLMEWYNGTYEGKPDITSSINKVVYIVPALNGSSIVGDVLTRDITFLDTDFFYNGFLETIMDEKQARVIEIALRILPDEVIEKVINAVVDKLCSKVLAYDTAMWSLCPYEDYEEAAKLWLSDQSMAEIKKQTDAFHIAQGNRFKNIQHLIDSGVEVFDIVDYDYPLYQVGNSWNSENGDGIIGISSTAAGTVSAKVGETLPKDYKQANTYCTDPENHNHISPDGVLDASTGYLCETTFYFDNQGHEKTASNDLIIDLAIHLLTSDDIKNVYSSEKYPEFNSGRNGKKANTLLAAAKNVDRNNTSAEELAKIDKLVAEIEEIMSKPVETEGELDSVTAELEPILGKMGLLLEYSGDEPEDPATARKISLWLFEHFGTNGFSEYPLEVLKKIFSIFKLG